MQPTLGIDLGTTNSVMARLWKGAPIVGENTDGTDLTPSVVARRRRGGALLVGTPAKGQNTDRILAVKRFMGRKFADPDVEATLKKGVGYKVTPSPDGDVHVWLGDREYTPPEVSSLVLHRLKTEAEKKYGHPFTRAVVTVPAYFGERQVAATREAGRLAGFHVLKIINEPTAAALAFGLDRADPSQPVTVLVYDLGGGTFDISILMLIEGTVSVLGIEGDNLLGGVDFDQLLRDRVFELVEQRDDVDLRGDLDAESQIIEQIERAKIRLSSEPSAEIFAAAIGQARVDIDIEVARDDFERLIEPSIDRTIELTQKAIAEAHLTPDVIDTILLVGGSSLIPLVSRKLEAIFGAGKIRRDVNPMQCVALGAAIQTALITEIICPACHGRSTIADDRCTACDAPLYGSPRVSCPTCFMLNEDGATTCWKCSGDLAGVAVAGTPVSTPAATGSSAGPGTASSSGVAPTCPTCGKPYLAGSTTCSICTGADTEVGGLACPNPACRSIIPPGETTCPVCKRDSAVGTILDITAKDYGIELIDGSMSVIIEKGTPIPTDTMHREEYATVAGQRRLEIALFEGPHPTAQANDFLGIVTIPLPAGLPARTPVTVGIGLDDSRVITTEVHVHAPGVTPRRVEIERHPLDPEQRRRLDDVRDRLTRFIDRWDREITDAERPYFYQQVAVLDDALTRGGAVAPGRPSVDEVVQQTEDLIWKTSEVRSTTAVVHNMLDDVGKDLHDAERETLGRYEESIRQARARADWQAGLAIMKQADEAVFGLNDNVLMIQRLIYATNHLRLHPSLNNRIKTAVDAFDGAFERGTEEDLERTLNDLWDLWPEVKAELDKDDRPGPTPTRPDRMKI